MSRKRDRSRKTTDRPAGAGGDGRLAQRLVQLVDAGLAGCIFVVPMLMGGHQALGRLALAALAVAVALAWTFRQCLRAQGVWRRSPAEWVLLGGVVLLVVQVIPLPAPVLQHAAPNTSELLPLWNTTADAPAKLGLWSQISLTPAATRAALVVFLAYSLLFVVTVQRIQALEDIERLLRWCALSTLVMAGFGLVQLVTSNGKFFWVYEHVYTDTRHVAKGAFANRNHFAHFLALGIGPLIWWMHDGLRRRRPRRTDEFSRWPGKSQAHDLRIGFRIIALGVVLFALLLSLSRGGAMATLLAVTIGLAVCYRSSSMAPRLVISLGAVALLIALSLAIFGHQRVARRLGTLTAGSLDALDGPHARRTIWSTVAKAIPEYAILGSGVGSHREVYPIYLEWTDSRKYFSHAECGYLQVTLESGIAGLGLLAAGVGLCAYWCIAGLAGAPSERVLVCVGAVSAGLAASVAHSLVDFVWYIPGCMVIVAVLAACACGLWQLPSGKSDRRRIRHVTFSRNVWVAAMAVLVVAGTWMLKNRAGPVLAEPHWDRFLSLDRDSDTRLPFGIIPIESGTSDAEYRSSLAMSEKTIAELKEVVRWEPTHARAHLQLAEAYIHLFHQKQQTAANVMPVNQIRDAAIESRSEDLPPERRLDSRQKLEQWLAAAIGDHYRYLAFALTHTRRALTLCPLLGEGYLYLGELCFLEGGRTPAKRAYVAQALKVRPFDGAVLLHAGSEAILAGEQARLAGQFEQALAHFEQGLAHWRDSFRRGPVYQEQIVEWLAGRLHPGKLEEDIDFFLDTFQPDLCGLRLLVRRYGELAPPEQMVPLRLAYASAVETEADRSKGPQAATLWLEAMAEYRKLKMPERRLQCGRNASRHDPNSLRVRQALAFCLADLEQFAEAREHLEWCLKRRPKDRVLNEKMKDIARKEALRKIRPVAESKASDSGGMVGQRTQGPNATGHAGRFQPAPANLRHSRTF